MEKLLDIYLKSIGLTRYRISKVTGISPTTLQRSSDKDAFTINPRIFWAISKVTDKTPGQVLDEVIEMEKNTNITIEEIESLMIDTFKKIGLAPYISSDYSNPDSGAENIVIELELPKSDNLRIAIYKQNDTKISAQDVLQDLKYALNSFEVDDEENYLPSNLYNDSIQKPGRVVSIEDTPLTRKDVDYLSNLSQKM